MAASLTPGRWNLSHTQDAIYLSVGQELATFLGFLFLLLLEPIQESGMGME